MSVIRVFEMPNGKTVKLGSQYRYKIYVRSYSAPKVCLKVYSYERIEDAVKFYEELDISPRFTKYFFFSESPGKEEKIMQAKGTNPQAPHPYREDLTFRKAGKYDTYAITISRMPGELEKGLKFAPYLEWGISSLSPKREFILLLLSYFFSLDRARQDALIESAKPKLERIRPKGKYEQEIIS